VTDAAFATADLRHDPKPSSVPAKASD
jgi:hypothetical protein